MTVGPRLLALGTCAVAVERAAFQLEQAGHADRDTAAHG